MQDFNKNMRLANQMINEGQIDDDLANVYEKIENIMKESILLYFQTVVLRVEPKQALI